MIYLSNWNLFESTKIKKYSGTNRIILLGPPTIGKTTISTELGKKLNLKVLSLDDIQASKFKDTSPEKEKECVEWVLSHKTDESMILDFGGGHIFQKEAWKLLKGYNNIFVLIPSEDSKLSDEILKKNSRHHFMKEMIEDIIKSLQDKDCGFEESKRKRLLTLCKKIESGKGGKLEASDIPKECLDKYSDWLKGGFQFHPDWNKYQNWYTKWHQKIMNSLTDNIIPVFTMSGNRKSMSVVVDDIIAKLK